MAEQKTIEMLIALAIVIVSFMYIYDALVYRMMDVLIAAIIFGAGFGYLFNCLNKK